MNKEPIINPDLVIKPKLVIIKQRGNVVIPFIVMIVVFILFIFGILK